MPAGVVNDDDWANAGVPDLGRWVVTLICGVQMIPTALAGRLLVDGPPGAMAITGAVVFGTAVSVGVAIVSHGQVRHRAAAVAAVLLSVAGMTALGLAAGVLLAPLETAFPSPTGRPMLLLVVAVILNVTAAIVAVLVGTRVAARLRHHR
jgi:hypothetical protein